MSDTRGEQEKKQRLKGEMMACEIWKERCRPVHTGGNLKPEAVIEVVSKLT